MAQPAVIKVEVRILRYRRHDDLCVRCWNPSLLSVLCMLVMPGHDRGPIIEHQWCDDCGTPPDGI